MNSRLLSPQTAFLVIVLLACLGVFIDAQHYPVSAREPLGAAAIPKAVAAITATLCLALLWQNRAVRPQQADSAPAKSAPRNTTAFWSMLCILCAYALLLRWPLLPSAVTTPLFVFSLTLALGKRDKRTIVWAAVMALVVGLGLQWLFKSILYVNLP